MEYIEHLQPESAVIILRMLKRYGRPPKGFRSRIEYEPTDDLTLMACREVQYCFSYWEDPDAMDRPPIEQADDDEDYIED